MDRHILDLINLLSLVTFLFLLILAIARIGYRYIKYKEEGIQVPRLLHRDGFFLTGLALPFLGALFFRAFGIVPLDEWWYPLWIIASNSFALLGTAYWVYYEYFKIEQ